MITNALRSLWAEPRAADASSPGIRMSTRHTSDTQRAVAPSALRRTDHPDVEVEIGRGQRPVKRIPKKATTLETTNASHKKTRTR